MFSVIIPCRGHGDWLEKSITSILSGSNRDLDLEVIVVFDADREAYQKNASLIESLPQVSAYATEGQSGAYRAMNVGISHARGSLVGFVGADDMVASDWASSLYDEYMLGYDVVNCWHYKMNDRDALFRSKAEALGGVYAYRSSLIKRLGGFEPWACAADSDLFYRAKSTGARVSTVRRHLYHYRQHENQLTKNKATQFGSIRRKMYEAKWHDGRVEIEMVIPNHRRLK